MNYCWCCCCCYCWCSCLCSCLCLCLCLCWCWCWCSCWCCCRCRCRCRRRCCCCWCSCCCLYGLCALDADTFSSDLIHGWRQHCSLKGRSSHDEHPWVKTVQATMSRQQKKNITTRCDRMRSCNRFSRAYPPACASRF